MIKLVIDGEPNAKHRCCHDCYYVSAAVNLWCMSGEAARARGTRIPGVHSCRYWKPATRWSDLPWYEKLMASFWLFGPVVSDPCDGTHGKPEWGAIEP